MSHIGVGENPPETLVESVVDSAGEVRELATDGWPRGYIYGATRYADVILRKAFPARSDDLIVALNQFAPTLDELRSGGGGRTVFVKRFDDSLAAMKDQEQTVWGKQNISISKELALDGTTLKKVRTRGHEIDMFGKGSVDNPLPGIAVEMEWNNKDPFFDRDLLSFQALHKEGVIAIGVIITRGPELQALIGNTIQSRDRGCKYGQSSTHWDKLLPRVNLGGGGECPLLLVGIEPERVDGIELAQRVKGKLMQAEQLKLDWRRLRPGKKWNDVKTEYQEMQKQAHDLMPPVKEE
ncbi:MULTISPECIES: BglII/BstYI family type II restriction endonuclease [Rhodanobacter]|uniref:BglII/BstYI family type II restriction endonuclease n=1 Tax=Rhodanobacter TaxID=75309 RepID=UPI0009DC3C68|nr:MULTISPECIES: BglII/BstYI family type II restriction endonuclease [Rhodanobacter]TAN17030.1 MAG: hypothetical protein EPN35_08280 [Rhodanobacter sp.]UJJ54751.1 hypothetical protein LRK53_17700 [Rhodanobacter thiooxydans]